MTVEAAKEANTTRAQLQQEKADPEFWNALNEVGHWKARWEMVNVAESPKVNPDVIPLVMSVPTATTERSFSAMPQEQSQFHGDITRVSGFDLTHVHKEKQLDGERIIHLYSL